ncbi:periplasmic component of amino acid ABC-type transporter/signal transduction system [Shewanella psychrophila]|uniref:Periplasmic component of amino acid ABC-type transporter/signal transduction system n=1 Tax=Shewanella psychrophila TaxID=225848 RepID=A0A1S6HMZ7_9GAMM|nr:transporter substrate-binding domain-containing protein [Shewanella psychrophila]AQS36890.1 periplasmic component of amino acid ABC-type transporter/signal transduction system [Shewanella psychrophila]
MVKSSMFSWIAFAALSICCLSIFLLKAAIAEEVSKPTLIVTYGSHNAEPYAITESNQLVAGIIKDISDEIADELDINVTYIETPRKRVERYLTSGEVHFTPISNPKWLTPNEAYRWSQPLFIEQDRLWVLKTSPKVIEEVEELFGKVVGTIRNFIYPTLTQYFEQKQIYRSDVREMPSNIARLQLKRIDGFIGSRTLVMFELTRQQDSAIALSPLVISEHNIHGVLSNKAPITLAELNNAIGKLNSRGVIDGIIEKYAPKE